MSAGVTWCCATATGWCVVLDCHQVDLTGIRTACGGIVVGTDKLEITEPTCGRCCDALIRVQRVRELRMRIKAKP